MARTIQEQPQKHPYLGPISGFLGAKRALFGNTDLIIMGKPPALPGDSQSLTYAGIYENLQIW